MTDAATVIGQHLRLTARLFLRYGLLLTAIWAGGMLLGQLLLRLAVEIGLHSRLLGLVAIAPVILLQLVIFVAFFAILRNGLPNMRLRRRDPAPVQASDPAALSETPAPFALALLAVLVPFYGYYAGWGLLSGTLRGYSQLFFSTQVARVDYMDPKPMVAALEIGQTAFVAIAVALIWVIRWFAQRQAKRSANGYWAILTVACEATWALLGLYVISGWRDEFAAWLATLPSPAQVQDWFVSAASAAVTEAARLPVDRAPAPEIPEIARRLFWYALLPVIWFNLGAIVYGHNMNTMREGTRHLAGDALQRWQALPKPIRDFIGHFWLGMVKRWHAVTNGVLLAASAGFALTASVVVLWRFVGWLGYWAWIGAAQVIGPQDVLTWQVLGVPLDALFNAPGAGSGGQSGGLLVAPLQFCILAAGLELAGRAQDHAAKVKSAADAEPV